MNSYPNTIEHAIDEGAQRFNEAQLFFGHGTDNAEDEAFWLVFFSLKLPFTGDSSVMSQAITLDQWQAIEQLFTRRIVERIPAAYITGEAWFCGYAFDVNASVLVPRSPIGELIEQQFQPWLSQPPNTILDLCTGSGCIGIACALYLENAQVDLADISQEALAVAQRNIQRHQLSGHVQTFQADVFSGIPPKHYDLIVTNPPYVDAADLASMPAEYHAEPEIALGSGDDGLDITRRLLRDAPDYLSPQGVMIVEVGNSWENMEAAFPEIPFLWLEFASGGHGVFLITRDELLQYSAQFGAK